MADEMSLGEFIRRTRLERGMRLRELARRLDVTPSYVSDIENDRRTPSEDVLRRIADVLDLDLDELLARSGRIGSDAERYLRRTPTATTLFRRISQQNLTEDQLTGLLNQVDELSSDNDSET
jgi:transcriptional regulator with XRE-family HTH domain